MTIVCFKWRAHAAARTSYGPETVIALRNMVQRWYSSPHRFVCVTDDARGLDGIETIPLWSDFREMQHPAGGKNPNCYPRLKLFDPAIESLLGPRFFAIDLDCVILGDLHPLLDRTEEFVIYGDTNPKTFYNGSLILMTAGSRANVWTDFDPRMSPKRSWQAGHFGSDQGWISYCLGPGETKFSKADGVYSYRNEVKPNGLPKNARVVVFHGDIKPWSPQVRQESWVREHYGRERVAA